MDRMPEEVADKLRYYVYRLIDPRNGETFYVGKGKGQRLFQHVTNALKETDDEDGHALKVRRIREIADSGLEVGHVIHRFGMETDAIAFQVEAAVMDAYPGLTNVAGGHGSSDFGCRHVKQVIDEFKREPLVACEPLMLISVGQTYDEIGDAYEAVRYAWKINRKRAETFKLVLAHRRGIVVGAYRPEKWMKATHRNFPGLGEDIPGRIGFVGEKAESETWALYYGKRVPDSLRQRGAAHPVRYIDEPSPQVADA